MGIIINESTFITNEDDTMEKNKKDQEYLEYIKDHILNVKRSYVNYMIPLLKKNNISSLISDEELKRAIIKAAESVQHHDDSKFGDDEFDGYRARWYPTEKEKNGDDEYQNLVKAEYDKAWEHHYTINPHHPLHWVDKETGISKDMSLDAIIEMLCDWEGMSLKFGTSTLSWYETKAKDEKKALSSNTKQIVEELLYNVLHK
jgi:hypothetical protein